jgi:2-octaprenyl-6-methoxyphenol hydroxylase
MDRFDIVIAGGGITGLSLALTLKRVLRGALSVCLVEAPIARDDDRAFAFSAGSKRLLQALGVWDAIEPDAQPIHDMVITDSRLDDPIRSVFLTFGGEAAPGEPFAHMIPEQSVLSALRDAVASSGLSIVIGHVTEARPEAGSSLVTLSDGTVMRASLVIASDGARSRLRENAGIGWAHWSYKQSGIVATIGHEREHHGRAEEHFLPSGPFAVLPLTGNRFTMVWSEATERARSVLERDDADILVEIEKRVGLRLGELKLLSRPRSYPLGFGLARRFGAERLALIGDAAHVIHPIAGQGLNMGLRDVATLAEIITDHAALGLDLGDLMVIEAYEKARRADTVAMASVTDALNRLFSNDAMPVRLMRDFGLGVVDRLPSLKTRLIREAAANNPHLPRLMRGESLPGF